MTGQEQGRQVDWVNKTIAFFASVKVTLTLIVALVALSFFGIAGWFGLTDVYHSRPFSLLLGLLFINLLVCTLDRLPGVIKRIQLDGGPVAPPPPREADFTVTAAGSDPQEALARAEEIVFGSGAHPRREQERKAKGNPAPVTEFVSFKSTGRWSLLGAQITHIGILLIILGGILGGMRTLKGSIHLSPGEQSSELMVEYSQSVTRSPLPFTVRCNDFKITFYKGRAMPSDYLCDLSVLVDGQEVKRQTIEVNKPLYYTPPGSLTSYGIYQANYFPLFRLTLTALADGSTTGVNLRQYEPYHVPGSNLAYVISEYEPRMTGMGRDFGPSVIVAVYQDEAFKEQFRLFQEVPSFDKGRDDPNRLSFRALPDRWATGLQVIRDPGVPLIWTGSFLLCLGASVALFISHRRYWLVARAGTGGVEITLIGRANRGQNLFKENLKKMGSALESGLKIDR